MNTRKIIFSIVVACAILTGCKENKEIQKETVALAISGMTCEIGCAKTIQSKLSKKEGVLEAKVVFTDSIANIKYDANTTSKKELIAYISGIAGGKLYTATEATSKLATTSKEHLCTTACKENCKHNVAEMQCKEDCQMACCADKPKGE